MSTWTRYRQSAMNVPQHFASVFSCPFCTYGRSTENSAQSSRTSLLRSCEASSLPFSANATSSSMSSRTRPTSLCAPAETAMLGRRSRPSSSPRAPRMQSLRPPVPAQAAAVPLHEAGSAASAAWSRLVTDPGSVASHTGTSEASSCSSHSRASARMLARRCSPSALRCSCTCRESVLSLAPTRPLANMVCSKDSSAAPPPSPVSKWRTRLRAAGGQRCLPRTAYTSASSPAQRSCANRNRDSSAGSTASTGGRQTFSPPFAMTLCAGLTFSAPSSASRSTPQAQVSTSPWAVTSGLIRSPGPSRRAASSSGRSSALCALAASCSARLSRRSSTCNASQTCCSMVGGSPPLRRVVVPKLLNRTSCPSTSSRRVVRIARLW
mmetsp:Transcript_50931/g.145488  ORF Transcript_50931/g.145488 Transcript_50931/m.145488 type:complete len:380 (-) Transcript_50931:473-1612(-)